MYMYIYEFAVRTHLYIYIYTYMYTFSFYICFYLYAVRTQREEAAPVVHAATGYNDVESTRSHSCYLHFLQCFYFVFIMRTFLLLILKAIFKSISPVAGWILRGANFSPNLQARFCWLILPVCRLQFTCFCVPKRWGFVLFRWVQPPLPTTDELRSITQLKKWLRPFTEEEASTHLWTELKFPQAFGSGKPIMISIFWRSRVHSITYL